MLAESAFRDLVLQLGACCENARSLRITVEEDAPRLDSSLLIERLRDDVLDFYGLLEEALGSAKQALDGRPADLLRCLAGCQEPLLRALSIYLNRLGTPEASKDLAAATVKNPEWLAWSKVVASEIENCREPLQGAVRALLVCRAEFAEALAMPMLLTGSPDAQTSNGTAASVEYARSLFKDVTGWYENADKKAQVLLGIDGAFLAFLSGSTFAKSDELSRTIKVFGIETWVLLALMCITLTVSIISAISCLWSRIYSPAQLQEFCRKAGVKEDDKDTYAPEVMWFFQFVVRLDKALFAEKLSQVDRLFETRVLASQISELSRNVLHKHQWLNWGFAFAGASLILLMAALASYLVHLRYG